MIAMQYSFVLPADYDMAIIRERIATRGHLLDAFPNLLFKAYLSAEKASSRLPSHDNLYAPFYVWQNAEGMNAFLCGSGFKGLTEAFGWPSIRTWSVWSAQSTPGLRSATCATRELVAIPPHADLEALRARELEGARRDLESGARAAVRAFEPGSWSLVRLSLWGEPGPGLAREDRQLYAVGHVSAPGFAEARP